MNIVVRRSGLDLGTQCLLAFSPTSPCTSNIPGTISKMEEGSIVMSTFSLKISEWEEGTFITYRSGESWDRVAPAYAKKKQKNFKLTKTADLI